MAAITNLYARYSAPVNLGQNLPIVVVQHGYTQATNFILAADEQRMAANGVFILNVGLRGSDNASGTKDNSRRELWDIIDAVNYCRVQFYGLVSQTLCGVVGYSGGGGNALGLACHFPDFFNAIIGCFSISDYGRDPVNSWYINNGLNAPLDGNYTATIATRNGGTPAQVPDAYYANDATAAITNFRAPLHLYADAEDFIVPYISSQRIGTIMRAAGLSNCVEHYTGAEDTVRWLHQSPTGGTNIQQIEPTVHGIIKAAPAWTIAASGTVTVIGYIVTKRFTIWLNSGLDAAATVAYDTVAGTYTVTPLTSNAVIAVSITQGSLHASGNTNGATTFTVA